MEELHNLGELNHRSRDRIKTLGEVFTPEGYVESMLDTLSKGKRSFWAKEDNVFFEPTCGHGNIVLPIVQRRVVALYKKAKSNNVKNPELYAIANTINSLWAIDIDKDNIELCRERTFTYFASFLIKIRKEKSIEDLIENKFEFFSHLLCSIKWHIHENEALSALSGNEVTAKCSSKQTKLSKNWFLKNGHNPLDFDHTWVSYFRDCEFSGVEPLDYERAVQYLENYLSGKLKGQSNFKFTKSVFKSSFKFEGFLDLEVI